MNRLPAALLLTLLAAGAFLLARSWPWLQPAGGGMRPLMVYCTASLKRPVEMAALQYRAETGVEVQLQYGGTATLLSAIRAAKRGDVFLAADSLGIKDARKYGLLGEVIPMVRQRPVLAVVRGNPKGLCVLSDLRREGVRLALANPETAAIGRVTRALLGAEYPPLASHATVTKPTVNDIATDLTLGAVDAALVWDSTVAQFPKLEAVLLAPLSFHAEEASAAVLSGSGNLEEALRFIRFLAMPEKGGLVFQKMGFHPVGAPSGLHAPQ